jgi:membrane protease YdiL (CAAX protease family)
MKGLLKSKSAGSQFLLLISIAMVSFFLLGLLGTMILSAITGINVIELSDSSKWDFKNPSIITFIRGMQVVQFISLFLVPSLLCARFFSTDSIKYLGLKKPSNSFYFLVAIAAMIVALPLVNWLGELNKNVQFPNGLEDWMKSSEEEAAKTVKALLSKQTIQDLVLNVICIAGLAAVGEELLFRGMVQRLLIKMFRTPWPGIIIAAFLFSAMHMQFYGFLPRFMLGILLGAIYWYSGSLWIAMLAHFVYDGVLIVLVYFNPEMLKDEQSVTATNIALIGSISFAGVVLLIEWMRKKTTTTYAEVYADDDKPVKNHPFDFE